MRPMVRREVESARGEGLGIPPLAARIAAAQRPGDRERGPRLVWRLAAGQEGEEAEEERRSPLHPHSSRSASAGEVRAIFQAG